jgi:hypothetical protein
MEEKSMSHKQKLFNLAMVMVLLSTLVFAGTASADTDVTDPYVEIIYYTDTLGFGDGMSQLFRVSIDEVGGMATLIPLANGTLPYDHVDVLAATPDGDRLYFVNAGASQLLPGTLGYYEVDTALVQEIGMIMVGATPLNGLDQSSISPANVMYVTNTLNDSLYTVDMATAEATLVGQVVNQATGVVVNISGGDIAFAEDGTLFMWANAARTGAPRGLYTLGLVPSGGQVMGSHIGEGSTNDFFNGLAVRANGLGDLVGSSSDGYFHLHSKVTADDVTTPLPMYMDGMPFAAEGGDLTTGKIGICTLPWKWWLNNSWDGQEVTVLGVVIGETDGKVIMNNLRGGDYSLIISELIVAKLHVNNSTGITEIDNAEAWLATRDLVNPDGTLDWTKSITGEADIMMYRTLFRALVAFNRVNLCR